MRRELSGRCVELCGGADRVKLAALHLKLRTASVGQPSKAHMLS